MCLRSVPMCVLVVLWTKTLRFCPQLTFSSVRGGPQGRDSARDAAVSPEPVAHLPQNRVTALLLRHARTPRNKVFMGRTVSGVRAPRLHQPLASQHAAATGSSSNASAIAGGASEAAGSTPGRPPPVTLDVSGDGAARRIGCDFLVLADGANSRLRCSMCQVACELLLAKLSAGTLFGA